VYSYSSQVLRPNSLLTNLVIDYEIVAARGGDSNLYEFQQQKQQQQQQSCDDIFVYMTDTASAAILVYDVRNDAAWRIFHPSMLPHPDHSMYYVSTNNECTGSCASVEFDGSQSRQAVTCTSRVGLIVIPVRYELNLYMLYRRNNCLKENLKEKEQLVAPDTKTD
jgi:hypothetical protein